jgi:NADP-dependent 3-hydroxy acid dehydrogenase YdfG
VYVTSRAPFKLAGAAGVIEGVNVQDNNCGDVVVKALNGKKVDILINNAGYFYEPVEKITSLNFEEEMKMIDICALGVLRITAAIFNAGLLAAGSKVPAFRFLSYSNSYRAHCAIPYILLLLCIL